MYLVGVDFLYFFGVSWISIRFKLSIFYLREQKHGLQKIPNPQMTIIMVKTNEKKQIQNM